jgi:hypothetical protein
VNVERIDIHPGPFDCAEADLAIVARVQHRIQAPLTAQPDLVAAPSALTSSLASGEGTGARHSMVRVWYWRIRVLEVGVRAAAIAT